MLLALTRPPSPFLPLVPLLLDFRRVGVKFPPGPPPWPGVGRGGDIGGAPLVFHQQGVRLVARDPLEGGEGKLSRRRLQTRGRQSSGR